MNANAENMKKQITVTVYDSETSRGSYPENLQEFAQWIQGKLDQIPERFQSCAEIEIDAYESYGDPYSKLTIEYRRPETDAEQAAREMIEQAKADEIRNLELATLEKLRAKYEL